MERKKLLLDEIITKFAETMEADFGFKTLDSNKGRWFELSWEDFKNELESKGVHCDECTSSDWQEYFTLQKEKVQKLISERDIDI